MIQVKELKAKANFIRDEVLRVSVANKAGHIAPSMSCIDILVALYYDCMSIDPENPYWEDRDRLVFSKAHGCYGLYAILADIGMLPKEEWEGFYTPESTLLGCMDRRLEYGIEAGCGSLGHGLPIAVGMAYGAKCQEKDTYTYCIIGDGEFQEGSCWEALQFAAKYTLDHLIIIVDKNRLQAMDFIDNVLDIEEEDLIKKLEGFGLSPIVCPGHDAEVLASCIEKSKVSSGDQPKAIIASTIKGYGLKCMENVAKFHFRLPTPEELEGGATYGN
ncbi:MAG: transketolase [Candidatus Omnitrophica bacterium]|nr:transketolase [Candidatus Omnitrophota bacterium]